MSKRVAAVVALLATALVLTLAPARPSAPEVVHTPQSVLPVSDPAYLTSLAIDYDSGVADSDELAGVQCPIPMSDRVQNYTRIQCVFSSLECLARWSGCEQLLEPEPLTSRRGCQGYSGPWDAASKLNRFGVRFEQEYRNRGKGLELVKKAMADGRGCLWGVPGHAMVLCHYDEAADVVKWIDNSDRSLRVQTTDVAGFNKRWNGWVLVIYAEPDPFPGKVRGLIWDMPVIDRNGPQGEYPKDYIPFPQK